MKYFNKRSKIKSDNRGLTLVELIVGVAILAIIVTPLLHVFITGANTERKSRVYGEATVAAKNLMELVEASDVDRLSSMQGWSYDPDTKSYTVSDVHSGTSEFTAEVSLNAEGEEHAVYNEEDIPFCTSMDVVFDMTNADALAQSDFDGECGVMGGIGDLGRDNNPFVTDGEKASVVIRVDPLTDQEDHYKVKVTFYYRGTYEYLKSVDGKLVQESATFTTSESAEKLYQASRENTPVFSLFLFYNAFFKMQSGIPRIIVDNNIDGKDFNVFLVSTTKSGEPQILPEIEYKKQYVRPCARVFTNFATEGGTYDAYSGDLVGSKEIITTELVEVGKKDRFYDVTIDIMKGDESVYTLCGTKLC